jgi:hypothetical protein
MKLISFDGMHENMKESLGSASKPFLILSASNFLLAQKGEVFRLLNPYL